MNVELKCEYCGVVFIHTHKIRFCSFECISNYGHKLRSEKALITKICKNCNKEFKVLRCKNNKYCSIKCRYEDHHNKTDNPKVSTVICKYCKEPFKVRDYFLRIGEGKFCSKECVDLYRSEKKIKRIELKKLESRHKRQQKKEESELKRTRLCEYCNKPFIYPTSRKKQRFCSNKCSHKYRVYGTHENYMKIRYGYCKLCNKYFFKNYKNQVYCSIECSMIVSLKLAREKSKNIKLKRDSRGRFMKKEEG